MLCFTFARIQTEPAVFPKLISGLVCQTASSHETINKLQWPRASAETGHGGVQDFRGSCAVARHASVFGMALVVRTAKGHLPK